MNGGWTFPVPRAPRRRCPLRVSDVRKIALFVTLRPLRAHHRTSLSLERKWPLCSIGCGFREAQMPMLATVNAPSYRARKPRTEFDPGKTVQYYALSRAVTIRHAVADPGARVGAYSCTTHTAEALAGSRNELPVLGLPQPQPCPVYSRTHALNSQRSEGNRVSLGRLHTPFRAPPARAPKRAPPIVSTRKWLLHRSACCARRVTCPPPTSR